MQFPVWYLWIKCWALMKPIFKIVCFVPWAYVSTIYYKIYYILAVNKRLIYEHVCLTVFMNKLVFHNEMLHEGWFVYIAKVAPRVRLPLKKLIYLAKYKVNAFNQDRLCWRILEWLMFIRLSTFRGYPLLLLNSHSGFLPLSK